MTLAKLGKMNWIDHDAENAITIHFGQITMRMNNDDFLAVASMFDVSRGETMPDENVCSVSKDEEGMYYLGYRAITLKMCSKMLSNFSQLCSQGSRQLQKQGVEKHIGCKLPESKWGHLSVVSSEVP